MHSAILSASVRAGNRGGGQRGRHDQDTKSKEEAPGKAEEEGEKGGCFAVPREVLGGCNQFARELSRSFPLSGPTMWV